MRFTLLGGLAASVGALNNGLGRTPQMGYNSWYDLWMSPTEETTIATAQAMVAKGLFAAGYRYVNLDDGNMIGRYANGTLYPDPKDFPHGMAYLADQIHALGMGFGLYTDRGTNTCGGRPGIEGHEVIDANTYAGWGVDYLKVDSCNAPSDHATAYLQYATVRDALNQTGRSIFYSLCGWEAWYSAIGHSLGNSFRIGGDDTNWPGVLSDIDAMAALWQNAGPGGWNDPCLLLGADSTGHDDVTELQSRAQFSMWAVLAAPMLLSQSVVNMSANRLETYLNEEVIGVGQDILGRQGQRLVGGPLSGGGDGNTPLTMQPCTPGAPAQAWSFDSPTAGFLSLRNTTTCANVDDCGSSLISFECVTSGGTCCGPTCYNNEIFSLNADGTLRSAMGSDVCVTSGGLGVQATLEPCSGSGNQQFKFDASSGTLSSSGACLTSGGSASTNLTNVWGRPQVDGSWALVFINAGAAPSDISCTYADCLSQLGWESEVNVTVRDLWAHKDLGTFNAAAGLLAPAVPAEGGVVMVRVTPAFNTGIPTGNAVVAFSSNAVGRPAVVPALPSRGDVDARMQAIKKVTGPVKSRKEKHRREL